MAETIVLPDSDEGEAPTVEQSAHEAAVAEGASAVQAEAAEEAADEAKAAADIALEAAKVNAETAMGVAEATAVAEGAAQQATVSADAVMQALDAQRAQIAALAEAFEKSQKLSAPPAARPKASSDQPPGRSKHWYYGR